MASGVRAIFKALCRQGFLFGRGIASKLKESINTALEVPRSSLPEGVQAFLHESHLTINIIHFVRWAR